MSFFKIIIPNYNSEKWIKKGIDSILNQTFKDFILIIADDMSTDNSVNIIRSYEDKRIILIENEEKRWNGGTRNVGIDYEVDSKYTLFMDCDDWLNSNDLFQKLHDFIVARNYPDCISLPYIKHNKTHDEHIDFIRNTRLSLASTISVAPWTKCIKSEKIVKFPENTLMEDVVQHIAQCDVLDTFASFPDMFVVWNRFNQDSIMANPSPKRKSSEWRQLADIMDLELKHNECIDQKNIRIDAIEHILKAGGHLW